MVARYVRNMKGQIRVKSELGKGTIFGIELPFEHTPTTPLAAPGNPPSSNDPPVLKDIPSISSSTPGALHPVQNEISQHIGQTTLPDGATLPSLHLQTPGHISSIYEQSGTLSSESSTDLSPSNFHFPQMDGDTGDRLSVLVAEDNPVNARVLTRRLQNLGHEVELALDGQQCHDHFASNPHTVDVILMDLQVRYSFLTDELHVRSVLTLNRCHW